MDFFEKTSEKLKRRFEEGSLRAHLDQLLQASVFLFVLLISIVVAMALLAAETDYEAQGLAVPMALRAGNVLLLIFYACETCARVYVEQRAYPKSILNLVDLLVLIFDVARLVGNTGKGSAIVALRTFRLVRVSRSVQVAHWLPELATMVRGLAGALTALIWGSVLMIFMLAVWGILATQLIHPYNEELTKQGVWRDAGCERCERAFSTVGNSMLTFTQQIVAGDSWGLISIPLIEAHPWMAGFFMMVLLSVQLALVNMILAVVLDKANASRQESEKELIAYREKEHEAARSEMLKLCRNMDTDASGWLTEPEIIHGFEENEKFRTIMKAMDIEREDLELVFRLMDIDGSGSVAYTEFTEQLFKMKTYDMHTLLVFIRFYVGDLWRKMKTLQATLNPDMVSEEKAAEGQEAMQLEQDGKEGKEEACIEIKVNDSLPHVHPVRSNCSTAVPSAWASEVDRTSIVGRMAAEEVKALTGPLSEDVERLREDLKAALAALGRQIEGQSRLLQLSPRGALAPQDSSPLCTARSQQFSRCDQSLQAPRKEQQTPRQALCCRPQREQVLSLR